MRSFAGDLASRSCFLPEEARYGSTTEMCTRSTTTSLAFQPMRRFSARGWLFARSYHPRRGGFGAQTDGAGLGGFRRSGRHARWQINVHGSRQHYSDGNIGNRQSAEVIREWGAPRLTFEMGYRYQHYSFAQELAHGYFSPNSYQSHLAMAGVLFHLGKRYRGAFIGRGGAESVAAGSPF